MEEINHPIRSILTDIGPTALIGASVGFISYGLTRYFQSDINRKKLRTPGTIAVVVGGSSGIGESLARTLATEGVPITVLIARSESKLRSICNEINETANQFLVQDELDVNIIRPGRAIPMVADVTDPVAFKTVVQTIIQTHGVPTLVFMVAGVGPFESIFEQEITTIAASIAAPLTSYCYGANLFLPSMMEHVVRSARVIPPPSVWKSLGIQLGILPPLIFPPQMLFINSMASRFIIPGTTAYTSARWGVRGLAAALQSDCRNTGVGITEVVLGTTQTPFFDKNRALLDEHIPRITSMMGAMSPEYASKAIFDGVVHGDDIITAPTSTTTLLSLSQLPIVGPIIRSVINWSLEVTGWIAPSSTQIGAPIPGWSAMHFDSIMTNAPGTTRFFTPTWFTLRSKTPLSTTKMVSEKAILPSEQPQQQPPSISPTQPSGIDTSSATGGIIPGNIPIPITSSKVAGVATATTSHGI